MPNFVTITQREQKFFGKSLREKEKEKEPQVSMLFKTFQQTLYLLIN